MLPDDYVTCRACGVAFERPRKPGHPPAYCSDECRVAKKRAAGLAYYYANLEEQQAKARAYAKANPEKAQARPSQQSEYRRKRYAEKRGDGDTRKFTCQICGADFEQSHGPGQPPRYCSDGCRNAARRARARKWREDNPERVLAQPSRQADIKRQYFASWYEANREAEIQRSLAYARGPGRNAKRKRDALRRALRKGSSLPGELFTLDDIFIRDRGVCHICGGDVERSAATMDHVIPITRGGPHTLANVRLAHRSCNTRKGNRMPD